MASVEVMLRRTRDGIAALTGGHPGPGDIHPGVLSNIDEAIEALRTGNVAPTGVASGLRHLVEYVSTPEWMTLAARLLCHDDNRISTFKMYLYDLTVIAKMIEGSSASVPAKVNTTHRTTSVAVNNEYPASTEGASLAPPHPPAETSLHHFSCPHCGNEIRYGSACAGHLARCARCGNVFRYPGTYRQHPASPQTNATFAVAEPAPPSRRMPLLIMAAIGLVLLLGMGALLVAYQRKKTTPPRPEASLTSTLPEPIGPVRQGSHTLHEVARMEKPSVTLRSASFGGQPFYTHLASVKVSRIGTAPLPAASEDLWVWILYTSGHPSPKELTNLMYGLRWNGRPGGSKFDWLVDRGDFVFEQSPFTIQPVKPTTASREIFAYSLVIKPSSARWSITNGAELVVPIPVFTLSELATFKSIAGRDRKGVAAVCLCGFQGDEHVLLSRPLVLELELPETDTNPAAATSTPALPPPAPTAELIVGKWAGKHFCKNSAGVMEEWGETYEFRNDGTFTRVLTLHGLNASTKGTYTILNDTILRTLISNVDTKESWRMTLTKDALQLIHSPDPDPGIVGLGTSKLARQP